MALLVVGVTAPPAVTPAELGLVALVNASAGEDELYLGQFCGGVAVAPRSVVTARHCVEGRPAASVDVVAGVGNLCTESARRVRVVSISSLDDPELVLLSVGEDLAVTPAGRATAQVGEILYAAGWGRSTVAGVPPCAVRMVPLVAVEPERCAALGAGVCTVPSDDRNTCSGDSGGPVGVVRDGRVAVVAVTMSGIGCGPHDVGLNSVIPAAGRRVGARE